MDKTVIGVFEDPKEAHDVVNELGHVGFHRERIGLLAHDENRNALEEDLDRGPDFTTPEPELDEAARGLNRPPGEQKTGGIADHLGGLSIFDLKGLGPMIAAGPFAMAFSDREQIESNTPLVTGFAKMGIPPQEASWYANQVQQGATMIAIEVDDDDVGRVAEVLERHGARELEASP